MNEQSTARSRLGRCGPNGHEQLLVEAALLPTDRAADSWRRWATGTSPQHTDWRSLQLVPFVAHRLGDVVGEEWLAWARAQRRRIWADNQRDLAALRSAVELLGDVVPRPLVVKGAALVDGVYPPGLRAMGDADLVVGPDAYVTALDRLLGMGWEPIDRVSDREISRAAALRGPHGRSLDLHRWALFPRSTRRDERGLIERATPAPASLPGAVVPDAADAILIAVLHGPDLAAASTVRWPVDVAMLVAAHRGDPDLWTRVVAASRELGVERSVGIGLDWCRLDLGLEVDADVCSALLSAGEDRWIGAERAVRRRGVPVVSRVRHYVDAGRALGIRRTPWGYARLRWSVLHESGGLGRYVVQRGRRASVTLREFRRHTVTVREP